MINEKISGIPFVKMCRGGGIPIPENADLNSLDFCEPGRYLCDAKIKTETLSNCPATKMFIMHVEHITADGTASTYINREIVENDKAGRYKQLVMIKRSTGEATYYPWMKYNFTEVTTT